MSEEEKKVEDLFTFKPNFAEEYHWDDKTDRIGGGGFG